MSTPVLDYVPRLVEANRAYRIEAPAVDLTTRARYWVPGPVLDQGREGACVGFGCTAEAMASPVRIRFERARYVFSSREPIVAETPADVANLHAREVYNRAKQIDEWEGVNYDGTSVRAGMLVGRERGWWTGFKWAFNMTELRAALEHGPVVVGVEWRHGMYHALDGELDLAGVVAGGHCILVTGYSPNWRRKGPHYRLRNSWGRDWGVNGSAYLYADGLNRILFREGGEAAIPVGRKS